MDADTLAAWVRRYQVPIYRYMRYLGADASAAADLVQDTFLTAFTSKTRPRMEEVRDASAWLRAIARNMFLRYCRREKSRRVIADSEYVEQAEATWQRTFLRESDGFDYVEALRKCIRMLSPREQEALNMRYRQRASRSRMARVLKLTESGVKSLLRRVRASLAECVERRLGREEAM